MYKVIILQIILPPIISKTSIPDSVIEKASFCWPLRHITGIWSAYDRDVVGFWLRNDREVSMNIKEKGYFKSLIRAWRRIVTEKTTDNMGFDFSWCWIV